MIETRHTSQARPAIAARRIRSGTASRPGMTPRSLAGRRRIGAILVGTGLAGILAATACALASVSPWLVPIYLLFVLAILAAPAGPRAASRLGPFAVRKPRQGLVPAMHRTVESTLPPSDWLSAPGESPANLDSPTLDESPETAEPEQKDESSVTRPRRGRGRSRKSARPAVEPTADPSPAAWIRIGPGKFVRADAASQAPTLSETGMPVSAEVESAAPIDDPLADPGRPVTDTPAMTGDDVTPPDAVASDVNLVADVHDQAEAFAHDPDRMTRETELAETPETELADPAAPAPSPEVEVVSEAHPAVEASDLMNVSEPLLGADAPDPLASSPGIVADTGPLPEEYGIAPSAFGPTIPAVLEPPAAAGALESSILESSVPGFLLPDVTDPGSSDAVAPVIESADLESSDPETSEPAASVISPDSEPSPAWDRPSSRSNPVPILGVRLSRARLLADLRSHRIANERLGETGLESPPSPCAPRGGAARRAFGRTDHVGRAWRARAPPNHAAEAQASSEAPPPHRTGAITPDRRGGRRSSSLDPAFIRCQT